MPLSNSIKNFANNAMLWLPALALASVPFGRVAEVFVLIMALIGINDLIKNQDSLRSNSAVALFGLVFTLFFLPGLLSLIDAVNIERSTKSVIGMLRFYFVGVFIISRIKGIDAHLKLGLAFSGIVTFWAIDGWLQAIVGVDLFGFEPSSSFRISGIFGENARLGLTIIPFLGISIFAIKKQFGFNWAITIAILLVATILISGDRAAWVSLTIFAFFLTIVFNSRLLAMTWKQSGLLVISVAIMSVAVLSTPQFNKRLDSALVGFEGGYEAVNKASSSRLPLWSTAYKIYADNPINGVGVRSFRYAYPDYAAENDPFVDFSLPREKQRGQTHAHQVVLEFATDTGLIGVLGYIVTIWLIYVKWLPSVRLKEAPLSLGYLLSLAVVLFPINTHQSFFSSHWGQIVWMLIALAIAAMASECNINKLSITKKNDHK